MLLIIQLNHHLTHFVVKVDIGDIRQIVLND